MTANSELNEIILHKGPIFNNLKNTINQVLYKPDRNAALTLINQIGEVESSITNQIDYTARNFSTNRNGIRTIPEMLLIIKNAEGPGTARDVNGNPKSTSTIEVFPDILDPNLYLVGYGHKVNGRIPGGWDLGYGFKIQGNTITADMREQIFIKDIQVHEAALETCFTPQAFARLNDNQFSGLLDIIYNTGKGAFLTFKKLRGAIEKGDYLAAANEFDDITNGGVPGLVTRRQKDKVIFLR